MRKIFFSNSPYKNKARSLAIVWTLLIFFACFIPGKELPNVSIPLIDKWVHFILFGVFTFLWLCSAPTRKPAWLILLFILCVFVGWLVEYVQGHYTVGRTQDNMDTLADSVGGFLGIILFVWLSYYFEKRETAKNT